MTQILSYVDLEIECDDGLIKDVKIYSTSLYPEMIDILTKHIKGARLNQLGIRAATTAAFNELENNQNIFDRDRTNCKDNIIEFSKWLESSFDHII